MNFELNINNYRNFPIELEFKRSHLNEDKDYSNSTLGYVDFLNEGGWKITIGVYPSNENNEIANKSGYGVELGETYKKISGVNFENHEFYEKESTLLKVNRIEECFKYLEIPYTNSINIFLENIWTKLLNEEINEGQAQDIFDEFSDILSENFERIEVFSNKFFKELN